LTVHLRLTSGEADITRVDGDRVTLDATVSAPPGATVDAMLDDGTPLKVKVRGCRKIGERFHVEGRVIDMSRALRARLSGGA
jgi:hypothetical protein